MLKESSYLVQALRNRRRPISVRMPLVTFARVKQVLLGCVDLVAINFVVSVSQMQEKFHWHQCLPHSTA